MQFLLFFLFYVSTFAHAMTILILTAAAGTWTGDAPERNPHESAR